MSEKRFVIDEEGISDNKTDKWYCWKEEVVDLLNEQHSKIKELEKVNEQLRKENFFLDYWKRKAMILLMQVRRLTPRMTDKEVIEFREDLEKIPPSIREMWLE